MKIIKEHLFFDNKPTITESKDGDGRLQYIISGAFTIADTPNGNNNIYPKAILNEAIAKLRERCKKGQVKMLMDHPEYEGKMEKTCAVLMDVTDVQADNKAYYKAQIIDEGMGKILRSIINAGGTVGVSTRGRGYLDYDQDWPGLPGKYNVIRSGFSLRNIDFVEEPSVEETEENVQVESKKEIKMKTLEELKKEYPEIFTALEKKHSDEINALNKAIEEATSLKTKSETALKSLIESLKTISPDSFTTIPESKIVESKVEEMKALTNEIATLKVSLEESKTALTKIEKEKSKVEMEKALEGLKASNPTFADYFKQEKVMKMYEACSTVEEINKVFESHKELIEIGAKKDNTPAAPKTQTPDKKESKELSKEQKTHLEFLNDQRRATGMSPYTMEQYLEKYSK